MLTRQIGRTENCPRTNPHPLTYDIRPWNNALPQYLTTLAPLPSCTLQFGALRATSHSRSLFPWDTECHTTFPAVWQHPMH